MNLILFLKDESLISFVWSWISYLPSGHYRLKQTLDLYMDTDLYKSRFCNSKSSTVKVHIIPIYRYILACIYYAYFSYIRIISNTKLLSSTFYHQWKVLSYISLLQSSAEHEPTLRKWWVPLKWICYSQNFNYALL